MPEITPGIIWIKLPISDVDNVGGPPDINVYLIRGDNGHLLVDSGWNTDISFNTMHNNLVKNGISFGDISQILVTHIHPDHYGMAGRIKQLSGATIAMHHLEEELIEARYIHLEGLLQETDHMLSANGVPHDEMVEMRDATVGMQRYVMPVYPDIRLRDGDTITTGQFTFRVIWTPGHSSGHLCLYEPDKKILLSGDHILPRITPNVSVHPQSIENPLGRYITALKEVRRLDTELTLPGHNEPFDNVTERIDAIIEHHIQRNMEILIALQKEMKNTYQIAREITWTTSGTFLDLPPFHKRMAVFETRAHLDMMTSEGYLDVLPRKGIIYYRQR